MDMHKLSETRKADRVTMLVLVAQLLQEFPAVEWEWEQGGAYPGPRCIQCNLVAPQGLAVTIEFDGDSCQPDVYVLSWHMQTSATAELNDATFGGSVNRCHRRKATDVAYGFADLCNQLKRGLRLACDGSAFLQAMPQVG